MAIFARLLAPTTSDSEFMGELVSELSGRNYESIAAQMRGIFSIGGNVNRDACIPLISKVGLFLEIGQLPAASVMLGVLALVPDGTLQTIDLRPIGDIIVAKHDVLPADLCAVFIEVATKATGSFCHLTQHPVALCRCASVGAVKPFLARLCVDVPAAIRPLVHDGVFERMSGFGQEEVPLLCALFADAGSRRYFAEMGYGARLRVCVRP
jgi:hypothetical protein